MEQGKYGIPPFDRGVPPGAGRCGHRPLHSVRVHSTQPGVLKPSGGGRLVAAPTGTLEACHLTGGYPPGAGRCGHRPLHSVRVHSTQRGVLKSSGGGRLVAAPAGTLGCVPFDRGSWSRKYFANCGGGGPRYSILKLHQIGVSQHETVHRSRPGRHRRCGAGDD